MPITLIRAVYIFSLHLIGEQRYYLTYDGRPRYGNTSPRMFAGVHLQGSLHEKHTAIVAVHLARELRFICLKSYLEAVCHARWAGTIPSF